MLDGNIIGSGHLLDEGKAGLQPLTRPAARVLNIIQFFSVIVILIVVIIIAIIIIIKGNNSLQLFLALPQPNGRQVGISGQEGLQAVMASDFAVSRYESKFCQVPGAYIIFCR